MKRLALLTCLTLPSAPPRRTNDGTPGNWFPLRRFRLWDRGNWFPLRRFRLWDRGKQSRLNAGYPPAPKVVLSYHTRQAADDAAAKVMQNCPENAFDVEDAGSLLQCINHFTGEIRDVTAGEWQAQWPRTPLPEDYQSKDYQSGNDVPKGVRKTRKGADRERSSQPRYAA